MTWWAWGLLWVLGSITGAAVHAAVCYARDLRDEREDRIRKAVALRNRIAALSLHLRPLIRSAQDDGYKLAEHHLAELDGILVEAARTGVPFDAEERR